MRFREYLMLCEAMQRPFSKEYKKRFAAVIQKDFQYIDAKKRPGDTRHNQEVDHVMAIGYQRMQQVLDLPDTDDLTSFVNQAHRAMEGGGAGGRGMGAFLNQAYYPNLYKFMARDGNLIIPLDMQQAIMQDKQDQASLFAPGISTKRRQIISQLQQKLNMSVPQIKQVLARMDSGEDLQSAIAAVQRAA